MKRWLSFVLLVVCLALTACQQGSLPPPAACETVIDSAVRCGTYRVGAFGGTSQEDDVARCARTVGLFNAECQGIFSDVAVCSTRACDDLEDCRVHANRFDERCSAP